MATVVTFGEIMLRLKAPAHERLLQSPSLEATFGGAESNVAIALAMHGVPSSFVSTLPDNALGDAAIADLRRFGVDTAGVRRGGERLGTYYFEAGAGHRPSRVVYDRAGSSFATTAPGSFDWGALFEGARWLHVSGVTPAVSASAAALCLEAVTEARARGLTVSCDYNYRHALWRWGKPAPEIMRGIVAQAHIGIAGREDCQKALGIDAGASSAPDADPEDFRRLAESVLAAFPNLRMQAITLRESPSARHTRWRACLHDRERFLVGRAYEITDIVDRVGAGDAFSAGLVYGLLTYGEASRALEFATAASCLKHTTPGDVNRVSVAEVEALVAGAEGGRVQR